MIRLLRDIAEQASDSNPYLGDRDVRQLQIELEALRSLGTREELRLRTQLGFHLLRIGRTDDAIRHLEAASNLVMTGQVAETQESAESLVLLTALAWLRKAEIENCLNSANAETCIFPIVLEGQHSSPEAARTSMRYLRMLLERRPSNLTARWLLNVAAMTTGDYPQNIPEPLLIPVTRFDGNAPLTRFVNVARELGVDVDSLSGGLIADDFDNDGWTDLMVSDCRPDGPLRLFRNNQRGGFQDVSEQAGLTGINGGLNIIQGDYNNDGFLDVLVLRGAWLLKNGNLPNSLLKNSADGVFSDISLDCGIAVDELRFPNAPTQTGAWADYDLDGDLDLCVGNESAPTQLFRNDGEDRFTDVAVECGIEVNRFVKGVVWGDYDHDGDPDLYVSCLDGPNFLFQNDGTGHFADVAEKAGVQLPLKSFGAFFWDYNNDGHLDLFVASYCASADDIARDYLGLPSTVETMRLYRGDGSGKFQDVTATAGLNRIAHPMGLNFGDVDLDGYPDFYLGTGDIPYQALMPNLFFYNHRGEGFSDVTSLTGLGHLQKGHGIAFADFDFDGDQDLAVELGGAFAGDTFRNAMFRNPGTTNHSLTISLRGIDSNRFAVGARLTLRFREGGIPRVVCQHVNSGGTFGANPLRQNIGVGAATVVDELEVEWPNRSQTRRVYRQVPTDCIVEITEDCDDFVRKSIPQPRF